MTNEKAITLIEDKQLAIRELETRFELAVRQRKLLADYIQQNLKPDKHYYKFSDDPKAKNSLTKEGAELICLPHSLKPHYEIIYAPEQPPQDDSPYQITVRCELRRGESPEGEGIGSASSMITKKDGSRVQRQTDPGLRHNATLKMAEKSAYIAATLGATAASEFFTQDMEDDNTIKKDKGQSTTQTGICPVHNIPWEKKGSKKTGKTWFSHLIPGAKKGEEWCNKDKVDAALKEDTQDIDAELGIFPEAEIPAEPGITSIKEIPLDVEKGLGSPPYFKDAGAFLTYCYNNWGKMMAPAIAAEMHVDVESLRELLKSQDYREDAWRTIKAVRDV